MRQFVRLQTIALSEPGTTYLALVRLFSGVDPQVPFQLKGVRTGVRAMGTLVRSFARVTTDVPLQLGQFHARVIALGTFVGFFVRMTVTDVAHQFT